MKSGAKSALALALAALTLGFSASAASAAAQIDSFDNGWYQANGVHSPSNLNIITGDFSSIEHRSFWVFDLTGLSAATAISITFRPNGNFTTDTGSETLGLFDFTGSIDALLGGTGGVPAFADLGTGTLLGQYTITAASDTAMPEFTVSLAPAFVAQFNAALASADQRIALGGALQTVSVGGVEDTFWSYSDGAAAARLNIETGVPGAVPEPSTWAMLLIGFGAVGAAIRRRRGARRSALHLA